MKTKDLIGPALDWAVAKCEEVALEHFSQQYGCIVSHNNEDTVPVAPGYRYNPSTDWSQGGPIIEREDISFRKYHNPKSEAHGKYYARVCRESGTMIRWSNKTDSTGPTPLVAAMRCYVASKLGDDVEIPEELK